MRTEDVRGKISVTDLKPRRRSIPAQHFERLQRISLESPPKSFLRDTCKRIGYRVEIRAHVQPEKVKIIGGIDDDVQFVGRQRPIQTEHEFRPANAAAERGDHRRSTTSSKERRARILPGVAG